MVALFSILGSTSSRSAAFIRPLPLLLLAHQQFLASSWLLRPPTHTSITRSGYRGAVALSAGGDSDSEVSEQELNRWDQLYQQGEAQRNRLDAMINPESDPSSPRFQSESMSASSQIRVVTFDLDNTLWNTGATIGSANDVLADFLNENKIVQSKRTEKIMGDLFQANKAAYCPLAGSTQQELDAVKAPVLLTKLRKDALRQILMEDNGYSKEEAKDFADQAFDKWMAGRYQAIPAHYASNVLSVFEQITTKLRDDASTPILVGAITDGNSDPRNVHELMSFFDFCINAEEVGVSKPDSRVYGQAMDYVRNHPYLQDMVNANTDFMEAGVAGPWWVHIGDDFSKDIVAAKNLNMRTIWARELILDKLNGEIKAKQKETLAVQYNANGKEKNNDGDDDSKPASVSPEKELLDFQEKINSQTVVKMAVGADDYLVASLQEEFADAIIDSFADLPKVLHQWQDQRLRVPEQSTTREEVYVPDEADLVRGWKPQSPSAKVTKGDTKVSAAPPTTMKEQVFVPEEADLVKDLPKNKFCVFCGAKLPAVAVFCSSCSQKQPEIQ